MHRVELKGASLNPFVLSTVLFLMHRVELKAPKLVSYTPSSGGVPNAPCGVESKDCPAGQGVIIPKVPNAPCGVESSF